MTEKREREKKRKKERKQQTCAGEYRGVKKIALFSFIHFNVLKPRERERKSLVTGYRGSDLSLFTFLHAPN